MSWKKDCYIIPNVNRVLLDLLTLNVINENVKELEVKLQSIQQVLDIIAKEQKQTDDKT